MSRALFLVPLAALLAVVALFGAGLTRDPAKLPSALIDRPLPAFALPGLRPGEPGFRSADLSGGGPKLLNVWASWCVSCRAEHPVLMRLKDAGVPVYGLAWKDAPEKAAAVLDGAGDPYVRTAIDADNRAGIDLGVTGTPETYVIDGEGRVRFKQVGPITPEVWARTIAPLMDELRGA